MPCTTTRRRSESDTGARQAGLFPQTMAVLGNHWAAALLLAAFLEQVGSLISRLNWVFRRACSPERLQTFRYRRAGPAPTARSAPDPTS